MRDLGVFPQAVQLDAVAVVYVDVLFCATAKYWLLCSHLTSRIVSPSCSSQPSLPSRQSMVATWPFRPANSSSRPFLEYSHV